MAGFGATANTLCDQNFTGRLFESPCIRLAWTEQFRKTVRQRCQQIAISESDLTRIEEDLFGSYFNENYDDHSTQSEAASTGILGSLTFEEFVRRQRLVEKNWPSGFKIWYLQKYTNYTCILDIGLFNFSWSRFKNGRR